MRTVTDRGPGFSLSTRTEHARIIATLCGELDIASAPALRDQLLDLLRPATSRLVLDLSAVSYADASGLAVLVGTGRRAGLLGGFLRLAAPAPASAVTRVLSLTGLHRQLEVFPTIQAAITSPPTGTRRLDTAPASRHHEALDVPSALERALHAVPVTWRERHRVSGGLGLGVVGLRRRRIRNPGSLLSCS
jgi:anti-anti-sigma factor